MYDAAFAGMLAVSIASQPSKALSPIVVTLLDIVKFLRLEQSAKASAPMLVTVSGMTSVSIDVLPAKALSLISTTAPPLYVDGIDTLRRVPV